MYIHIYIYIYKQASHYVTLHVITLCYVACTHTHTHAGIHIHMDIHTHTHTCDMCIHSTLKTYVQLGTNTIYIDIQDTNY